MTTIMINGIELDSSLIDPAFLAALTGAAVQTSAATSAKAELDKFVADTTNTEFLLAFKTVTTAKHELDSVLETVKTLRASFASAQDAVNAKYPDQNKRYGHLVATATAVPSVITGRVNKTSARKTTGTGTGTGRSTSKWELTVDGVSHSWKAICEDVLGITAPAGNYNARRRVVDAYNASVKDSAAAIKTYGVALDSDDMARIVIANSDKVSADDLAEMLAIGCTLNG